MTDETKPTNLVNLADVRAARDSSEDEVADDFDAGELCWAVSEGESSFVALRNTWSTTDAEALDPDEADALAVALIRAAQKCREARGDE